MKKLDHKKVGPFLINKVYFTNDGLSPVNYKLQLPPDARIHPVFYISLLELANPNTPLQETFHYEVEKENEFEIEAILVKEG